MALIIAYQAQNMFSPYIWYGTVIEASPIRITLTNYAGKSGVYNGTFTYSSSNLTGGVVTSYDGYNNYRIEYEVSGVSLDAVAVKRYTDLGDALGLFQYALSGNDQVYGSNSADTLAGWDGNDIIYGQDGNDQIYGGTGNDTINGGFGTDTALYSIYKSGVLGASRGSNGEVILRVGSETETLINTESLGFTDGVLTIDQLLNQYAPPSYQTNSGNITASIYIGAVSFLDFQMLGSNSGDVATGSTYNDFMNLLGGDDAANGGNGQDVLDGGVGSNFLTGGSGADTFFLDGRSGSSTWSTITDFSQEDSVNIWGWQQGVSQLILSLDNQGASGYKGATFHYDLNGDRLIDTSITFSNLALASLPSPSPEEVGGNGYLLFI